jgi:hypothetical protein
VLWDELSLDLLLYSKRREFSSWLSLGKQTVFGK